MSTISEDTIRRGLRDAGGIVDPERGERGVSAPAAGGARLELDLYFEGKLKRFGVPVDWRLARGFTDKVLHQVARIPYGRTLSYGEVAAKAGNPRAFRAAGTACGANPVPLIVPCHRVVQASGDPG